MHGYCDNVRTWPEAPHREKEAKTPKMHRVERFQGSFLRSFTLHENVDAKGIKADMKEGVLQVHLPKTAATEAKKTKVEVT